MLEVRCVCARPIEPGKGCWLGEAGNVHFAGGESASLYEPLKITHLHRELADADTAPEAALAFAARYGVLEDETRGARPAVQSAELWALRVTWMRRTMELVDLVKARGTPAEAAALGAAQGLISMVRDEDGDEEVVEVRAGDDDPLRLYEWELYRLTGRFSQVRGLAALMAYLCHRVPAQLTNAIRASVSEDGAFSIALCLPNLWAAAVWLVAEEVDKKRTFRRCAACRRWLVETPFMSADAAKTTCSDACRQRLARRRRAA